MIGPLRSPWFLEESRRRRGIESIGQSSNRPATTNNRRMRLGLIDEKKKFLLPRVPSSANNGPVSTATDQKRTPGYGQKGIGCMRDSRLVRTGPTFGKMLSHEHETGAKVRLGQVQDRWIPLVRMQKRRQRKRKHTAGIGQREKGVPGSKTGHTGQSRKNPCHLWPNSSEFLMEHSLISAALDDRD